MGVPFFSRWRFLVVVPISRSFVGCPFVLGLSGSVGPWVPRWEIPWVQLRGSLWVLRWGCLWVVRWVRRLELPIQRGLGWESPTGLRFL